MYSRTAVITLLVIAAATGAHASILDLSEDCEAAVVQYDNGTYWQNNQAFGAGPIVMNSPFFSTSVNGNYMDTVGSFSGGISTNTAAHALSSGSFSGVVNSLGEADYAEAEVVGFDKFSFDTDSSMRITIKTSGTSVATSGTGRNNTIIYIDGVNYQTAGVDGYHSVVVGAGSHQCFIEIDTDAFSTDGSPSGSASMSQNYVMDVTLAPEPASLTLLAVGALGLLRKRRKF